VHPGMSAGKREKEADTETEKEKLYQIRPVTDSPSYLTLQKLHHSIKIRFVSIYSMIYLFIFYTKMEMVDSLKGYIRIFDQNMHLWGPALHCIHAPLS